MKLVPDPKVFDDLVSVAYNPVLVSYIPKFLQFFFFLRVCLYLEGASWKTSETAVASFCMLAKLATILEPCFFLFGLFLAKVKSQKSP